MRIIGLLGIFACTLLIVACKQEVEPKKVELKTEQLIYNEAGMHTEYYPGKKQIKIQGELDSLERKQGRWVFYSEKGLELTTTTFKDGVREGFSLVKFPNGQVRYYGDYLNDKKSGVWKTYDSKGVLVDSTKYENPTQK